MDSVTQAVLGAVVADLTMGRQLDRRATVWGFVLGTLPDLDVLIAPWLSTIELLSWHRGISHGILAVLLVSPILGWCLHRLHRSRGLSWQRATISVGLIWLTHVLIDCFNLYGTGLWEPFSSLWVSFKIMFIIDIPFTLPLLLAAITSLVWSVRHSWRLPLTWVCLTASCCYIGWAVIAKTMTNHRFATSLDHVVAHGFKVNDWHSAPMPLNTVLWRCLAQVEREGEPGFLIGLASLLDDDPRVVWRWVPQIIQLDSAESENEVTATQATTLSLKQTPDPLTRQQNPVKNHAGFEAGRWFSKGYWLLVLPGTTDQPAVLHDLRFGSMKLDIAPIQAATHPWAFSFQLVGNETGEKDLTKMTSLMRDTSEMSSLWRRLTGTPFAWEQEALQTQKEQPLLLIP